MDWIVNMNQTKVTEFVQTLLLFIPPLVAVVLWYPDQIRQDTYLLFIASLALSFFTLFSMQFSVGLKEKHEQAKLAKVSVAPEIWANWKQSLSELLKRTSLLYFVTCGLWLISYFCTIAYVMILVVYHPNDRSYVAFGLIVPTVVYFFSVILYGKLIQKRVESDAKLEYAKKQ